MWSCLLVQYLILQIMLAEISSGHYTRLPMRRVTGRFIIPFVSNKYLTKKKDLKNVLQSRNRGLHTQQVPIASWLGPSGEQYSKEYNPSKYEQSTMYSVFYHLMYVVDLSIGTPPQPFRAIVDITQSNLFVPSVNCTQDSYEGEYCLTHLLYDSTRSSTYTSNLMPAKLHYYGVYTSGNLSQDTVRVGNIEVTGQVFHEAIKWHPAYTIDWDEQYDSVLGLARFRETNQYDTFNVSGPLENMINQKALDRNIFALNFPHTDEEEGELILGGVDDSFAGDLITLPLLNIPMIGHDSNYVPYASAGWQVEASSFAIGSYLGNQRLEIPLPRYIAILTNGYTHMMFPRTVYQRISEHLNFTDYLGEYSCDQRQHLPNITFALGPQDREIVLTPWHYMHEVIDLEGKTTCTLPFHPLYEDSEHPYYILLGSAFLAGFYAEFDMDKETIGLAYRDK